MTLAWKEACSNKTQTTTVLIPKGAYMMGAVTLIVLCSYHIIRVQVQGTLKAPSNQDDIKTIAWINSFSLVVALSIVKEMRHGDEAIVPKTTIASNSL